MASLLRIRVGLEDLRVFGGLFPRIVWSSCGIGDFMNFTRWVGTFSVIGPVIQIVLFSCGKWLKVDPDTLGGQKEGCFEVRIEL